MLVLVCKAIGKALFRKKHNRRPVGISVPRERMYQGQALGEALLDGGTLVRGSK